ncbi:MAG: shikimate dehydrogenase [Rhodospirillales bacterium]|nr:MAG: shikimate dehydrogenase [Rhodospirillales bacterium]
MPSSHPVLCGSIAGRPGRFGVAMHNAAYQAMGLDFVYVAFGTEDTAAAVAAMRALGIRGLGVTMPHKQRIMAYLDRIDQTARAIGAVNTVVNDDGVLTGYNVDWVGAVRAFREKTDLSGKAAAVIGAGGGARAIVYGLVDAGARVTVFNRTASLGAALAASLGVTYAGPPDVLPAAGPFDLIAHATPVGLGGGDDTLVPEAALMPGTVVFDAVPVPVETALLRAAEARGCLTIPGVRMQLHQAAYQFALYTGREPDLTVMESALQAALRRDSRP